MDISDGSKKHDDIEKKRSFIINVLYYAIITAIAFFALRYSIEWLMPFIIGFIIASMLKPLIRKLEKKIRINRKLLSALVILVFYATMGVLIGFISVKLFVSIRDVFSKLPDIYKSSIEPSIYTGFEFIVYWFSRLDPSIMQGLNDIITSFSTSLGNVISSISSGVVGIITNMLSSVPSFFVKLIFSIISSFYFAIDYDLISKFLKRQLPEKASHLLLDIKTYTLQTLLKFCKAYGIIIGITFMELSIGFLILGVDKAFTIAAIIAVLDIIPVLGVGGAIFPWALVQLIKGRFVFAIGLIVLYVIVLVVRNIIEPKVVGGQVGLHPVVMLICMFAGVKIFGVLGLFVMPVVIIILKNLNDSGKIRIFK